MHESPEKHTNEDHKNLPPTAIHLMMVSQSLLLISNIAIKNEIDKQENVKREMQKVLGKTVDASLSDTQSNISQITKQNGESAPVNKKKFNQFRNQLLKVSAS